MALVVMPPCQRFVGSINPAPSVPSITLHHLPRKQHSIRSIRATRKHPETPILHLAKSQSPLPLLLPHMESYASLHYAFVLMGYANAYPPPPQVEYDYPYSTPLPPKVYPSPPSPSYQGYFNDDYPPPPPSLPDFHSHDGYCLSFLKGCLAAFCCCCMVEECYF